MENPRKILLTPRIMRLEAERLFGGPQPEPEWVQDSHYKVGVVVKGTMHSFNVLPPDLLLSLDDFSEKYYARLAS